MAQDFTLDDFRKQFAQFAKPGMKDMIARMPGMAGMILEGEDPDAALGRIERMIDAMTEDERRDPDTIDEGRRSRIAAVSDTQPHEVEEFLAQFREVRTVMRQMANMSFWQRLKLVAGFGKHPGLGDPPAE